MDIVLSDWIAPVLGIPLPKNWKVTNRKKVAEMRNRTVWRNLFFRNLQTASDRYYIEGLPDTCSQRVSIMSLLWYGRSLFFEKDGNVYNLPCTNASDGFTINGEWRKARWVALNGMSEEVNLVIPGGTKFLSQTVLGSQELPNQTGVLVRENRYMYPFITYVIQWTDYECDTLRALDTARRHLKHPTVIAMPESEKNSIKGIELALDDNQDVLPLTKMIRPEDISVLNMGYTGITDELKELYEWYDAQFKGFCGIAHNAGSDKKGENLITAEIGIDTEDDNTNINSCMDSIQEGLDLANEVFGLNMQVKTNHVTEEKEEMEDDLHGLDRTDKDDE